MNVKTTLFSALLMVCLYANAQNPGQLDASFGTAGKVIANPYGYQEIYASAVQSDGRIVSVGMSRNTNDYNFSVMRFNINGTVDTSFGTNGAMYVDMRNGGYFDSAKAVVIQPDGKIIVGGSAGLSTSNGACYFGLIRLNTNGTLDTTFGTAGKTSFPVGVATSSNQDNRIHKLALQSDGKILAVGEAYNDATSEDIAIVRLNTDGSLDTDFSNDGKATVNFGTFEEKALNLRIDPDGKILMAGEINDDLGLVRFYNDGGIDTSYGTNGKLLTETSETGYSFNYLTAVAFQADGKILALGTVSSDVAIRRINSDGTIDTTFGTNGKVQTDIDNTSSDSASTGFLIQPDGYIIATSICATGGTNYFATLRYTLNGLLDNTFSNDGKVLTNMASGYNSAMSAILDQDGKLLISGFAGFTGQTGFALARYGTGILGTIQFERSITKLYPNPTSDKVHIVSTDVNFDIVTYSIVDPMGKTIVNGKLIDTNQIDLSGLNAGVYFIKIENQDFKIIKL